MALTKDIPASIQAVLADDRTVLPAEQATTAVFYSISNCQPGLRGISFGNFLIKQVVADLSRDLPALKTFVTLSPAPGFGRWLKRAADDPRSSALSGDHASLARLENPDWHLDPQLPNNSARSCWVLLRPTTSRRRPRTASRSIRSPGSTSATAPAWSASIGLATRRAKVCAKPPD